MSDTLQLGVSAATAAVPGVSVQTSTHPTGNEGVGVSVERANEKIAAGRNDWRIQEWAGQALKKAGDPPSVRGRAQAILDALRAQTVYVQDPPGTEMIKGAVKTLCLEGDRGVCLRAGDCDDLVVAFCTACMSIGIPCKTIIQAFDNNPVFTHIIAAVLDDKVGDWIKVDPASKKAMGDTFWATKEKWFDPMDKSTIALSGKGDYVGVGAAPRYVRLGLGDAGILDDAEKAVVLRVTNAVSSLRAAALRLSEATNAARDSRMDASGVVQFDPEPAFAITDLSLFPVDGSWTESMDAVADQVLGVAWQMVSWGNDVVSGARGVYLIAGSAEAQVEALASDPYAVATLVTGMTDSLLGIIQAGAVTVGILTKSGAALTPAAVAQAQASGSGTLQGVPVGVGEVQIVPLAIGAAVSVAVGIAAYYAWAKLCDMGTSFANAGTLQAALNVTDASGNPATPEQKALVLAGVTKATLAQAELEKAKNAGATDWATVAKWGAVAAVAVGAAVLLAPVVREAAATFGGARRAALPEAAKANPRRGRS